MKAITRHMALLKQTMLCDNRSIGFLFLRLALLGMLLFVIFIYHQQSNTGMGSSGRLLFMGISAINMIFAFLASFCLFLPLLHEEKEEDTLGIILMTGISPFAYIAGRCGSRMVSFTLILFLQVPFTLLCITFGGVTIDTILMGYLMVICYMFYISSLCFMVSMFTTSYFMGFFITATASYGIHMLMAFTIEYFFEALYLDIFEAGFFFPIYMVVTFIEQVNLGMGLNRIYMFMGISLLLSAIFYSLAVVTFNWFQRIRFREVDLSGFKKKLKNKQNKERFLSRLFNVRFAKNAIAHKTFLFNFRGNFICFFQLAAFGIFIWLEYYDYIKYSGLSLNRFASNGVSFFSWVLVIVWLTAAQQMFGSEIKNKTLESLLVLPVSNKKIFHSKLLAVVALSLPTLIPLVAAMVYSGFFDESALYIHLAFCAVFILYSYFAMKLIKGKMGIFLYSLLLIPLLCSINLFADSIFGSFEDNYFWFLLYGVEFVFLWVLFSMYFRRYSFFFSVLASFITLIAQPILVELLDEVFLFAADYETGLYLAFTGLLIGLSYNLILLKLKKLGESH